MSQICTREDLIREYYELNITRRFLSYKAFNVRATSGHKPYGTL